MQLVQLLDLALRLRHGRGEITSSGAPTLLNLIARGQRPLFGFGNLVLLSQSQLLLTLSVQTLMDGHVLAVRHGLNNLLREVVDSRFCLQFLQLILNCILLRFELLHAAIFEETLLVAEEAVEVAHFLAVAIQHSAPRLESVRGERAAVELLILFHLASVLEVLLADLAKDVLAQHVLLVARVAVLGEQCLLVLGQVSLTAAPHLVDSLIESSCFETTLAIRRKAGPVLACPLVCRRHGASETTRLLLSWLKHIYYYLVLILI